MILAAGRGERMRPLTDSCPKPLLTIHGKPLIAYHLEALKRAGIDSVIINVSWLADQIMQSIGNGSQFGLHIDYSHEPQALETAGGILQALPKLRDRFIVVNGDVFTNFDFGRLLNIPKPAHLVLVDNPGHNVAGDFAVRDGLLSNDEYNRFTFSGIACYRKNFFDGLKIGRRSLAPLLRDGADRADVSAEIYRGAWSDVGTVERLKALNKAER